MDRISVRSTLTLSAMISYLEHEDAAHPADYLGNLGPMT